MRYTVSETPCYPAKWKVHPVGRWGSNATHNYFRDLGDALDEAARRNSALEER